MGVRGLYTYINELPEIFKTVNIVEELQKYHSQHGRDPVIIVNLWTMSYRIKSEIKDVIVGYRMNKIEKTFEGFLQKLKNAGAELIFVFKKTQIRKDYDFVDRQEDLFKKSQNLIKDIEALGCFSRLEERYTRVQNGERSGKLEFPFNNAVMLVMCQVAKRYGKLHGINTINNRQSTFQVQLANQHNAFAILGLDTHYIFYEGSWRFWSDAELNMDTLTVRQYDKEKILRCMCLTPEQAPLFVTLAGHLMSSEVNVKTVVKFFKPWTKQLINNVSVFVNNHQFPLSDNCLTSIISEIFGHCSPEIFMDFKETMLAMDIKENMKTLSKVDVEVLEMTKHEYANLAEEILENATMYISPVFMDLHSNKVHDLVIPFIAKTAGILLKNKADKTPRTVLVKKSDLEDFIEVKIQPIVPEFDVPQLKSLVGGLMALNEKFKLLKWLSGLNELSVEDLKSVPNEFIVDVIICLHLVKNKAMKVDEAECLLQSIVDVHEDNVLHGMHSESVSGRAFQLGFLYMKMFFFVHSCTAAVGLKIFQNDLKFDGRHFQKLFAEKESTLCSSSADLKLTFKRLLEICSNGSESYEYVADDEEGEEKDVDGSLNVDPTTLDEDLNETDKKIVKLFKEGNFLDCLKKLLSAEKNEKLRNDNRNYKIECLLMLDRLDEAGKILKVSLRKSPNDSNLLFLQGLKFYYESDMKKSIEKFNEAAKISSWMIKAQVQRALAKKLLNFIFAGCSEVKANNFKEARDIFIEASTVDSTNKKFNFFILTNLGVANSQLDRISEAFDSYSKALRIKENSAKCLFKRAEIHFKMMEFEDCVIDCEESLKLELSGPVKSLMADAKTKIRATPERGIYEILGIASGASKSDVKKAYHKLSLLYHVDKHPLATQAEKLKLNRKFREIKVAYDKSTKL